MTIVSRCILLCPAKFVLIGIQILEILISENVHSCSILEQIYATANLTIHSILKVLDAHTSDEMNVPPLARTSVSPQFLPLAVQYSTEQNIVFSTSGLS